MSDVGIFSLSCIKHTSQHGAHVFLLTQSQELSSQMAHLSKYLTKTVWSGKTWSGNVLYSKYVKF